MFRMAIQNNSEESSHNSLILVLWTVGYPILAMFIAPNARHYNRYMMPFIPFYMLLAADGFYSFLSFIEQYWNRIAVRFPWGEYTLSIRPVFHLFLALMVGVSIFLSVTVWSHRFANDVQNINNQQVAMGKWVKKHISDESVVALSDIGAITHIAGRKKIIDMVGLVNPELISFLEDYGKDDHNALLHYLHREKPDYIITHPNCYPQLLEEKNGLEEIHSIVLKQYSGIGAGQTMAVYKTHWDKLKGAD